MKKNRWQLFLGLILIVMTILLYLAHYIVFKDAHHIFIYGLGDLAFIPLEVLLVTLIIHQLLGYREKKIFLQKLNMIIGVFFSQVGTYLLAFLSDYDTEIKELRKDLLLRSDWPDEYFEKITEDLKDHSFNLDMKIEDLKKLKQFLEKKSDFLLRLLENPNLLEHETFTELMRAVFHLTEELASRRDMSGLPLTDVEHLVNDAKRAYSLLVYEWIAYMRYLKDNYQYLFSLAVRTNPFDQNASSIVK